MVRAIVLETSASHTEVALADESGILAKRLLAATRKHARDLAPSLKEIAVGLGWKFGTIDLIVVDIGPGSYTGLRVGTMTAKMLAYATKASVIAVDAMTILAEGAPADARTVSAIIDAQQGQVYSATMSKSSEGVVTFLQETMIGQASEWAKSIPVEAYVTGPALSRFRDLVPVGLRRASPEECSPTAAALWRIGWGRYQSGVRDDPWTLEPLYLRSSSAEIKWDRRLVEKSSQGQ